VSAVKRELVAIAEAYGRAQDAVHSPTVLRVGRGVEVRRWDVEPVIASAAPPTYVFPAPEVVAQRIESDLYTIELFREVACAALHRIESVWPELAQRFGDFVRVLVHIPDAGFRSASASRYRAVVFLSSDDVTLLELEESLVHEFGHQVLYRAMMLDPLLLADGTEEYVLPWSGSRRDFYGYFHAFYIYLLLAKYLERASVDPEHDHAEVQFLLEHIAAGLIEACKDFEPDGRFTPSGRAIMGRLLKDARAVGRRCETL
jgi:HEXXH motif-containing protein